MSAEEHPYGELRSLAEARNRFRSGKSSGTGDGGGPPQDMNARIEKLEAGHATIIEKLSEISATLKVMDAKLDAKADAAALERVGGDIRTSLATMQGEIAQKASATVLSDLGGTVKNLPGIGSLITLVLGAIALSLGGAAGLAFALVKIIKP